MKNIHGLSDLICIYIQLKKLIYSQKLQIDSLKPMGLDSRGLPVPYW